MGILDEDVQRVKESSDIVAVISEHTALRKVGTSWSGLCPFHAEKSPSFSVSAEKGAYYCFGCQAKGDVITFVREIEHLDFSGAVERLAARASITLRYTDRDEGESRKKRARLVDGVAAAMEWYHQRLLASPDAARARSYLRSRGFDGDIVRRFGLGWAPEKWDEMVRSVKVPEAVLLETGLGSRNRHNRVIDRFRGRIMFPILDPQGDPIGFGGRILPGGRFAADSAKYLNPPENPLYEKSKVLYGLNWAKAPVVAADEVIVCEGYTDVIGFAQAGIDRAVATCGTALTEQHVRLLRKYARRVVLAFDADAAGQAAAERFYQWERTHEIDVAVADLPNGVDPGDLAQSDPERLRQAVSDAIPFLGFRVERIFAAGSLSTAEGRAKAAEAALEAIAEHPNELVRDQYLMEVASRCRLDPDTLRPRIAAGRGRVLAPARSTRRPEMHDSPEAEALRLALVDPSEVLPWLGEYLFEEEQYLRAYRSLAAGAGFAGALELADPDLADLLHRLVMEDATAELDDVLALLVVRAGTRALKRLHDRAREMVDDPAALRETLAASRQLGQWVDEVRGGEAGPDAVDRLLGWLATESEVHG